MRKGGLKEVKKLAQGHRAPKQKNQDETQTRFKTRIVVLLAT